jgi:hypothetical protein
MLYPLSYGGMTDRCPSQRPFSSSLAFDCVILGRPSPRSEYRRALTTHRHARPRTEALGKVPLPGPWAEKSTLNDCSKMPMTKRRPAMGVVFLFG